MLVFLILRLLVTRAAAVAAAMLAMRQGGAGAKRREYGAEGEVAKCFHLDLLWLMQGSPAPAM